MLQRFVDAAAVAAEIERVATALPDGALASGLLLLADSPTPIPQSLHPRGSKLDADSGSILDAD
jgi:hypothetical protein